MKNPSSISHSVNQKKGKSLSCNVTVKPRDIEYAHEGSMFVAGCEASGCNVSPIPLPPDAQTLNRQRRLDK